MTKYGIFRGDKIVGRIIFNNLKNAMKERDEWNEDLIDFNKFIKTDPIKFKNKKPRTLVEVKEYKKKRISTERRLRELMS
jgi:hypothetical protein